MELPVTIAQTFTPAAIVKLMIILGNIFDRAAIERGIEHHCARIEAKLENEADGKNNIYDSQLY